MERIHTDGRCLRRRGNLLQRDRQRTAADQGCQIGCFILAEVTFDDAGRAGDDLSCGRIGNDLIIQHDDDRIIRRHDRVAVLVDPDLDRGLHTAVRGGGGRLREGLCSLRIEFEGYDIAGVFLAGRQGCIFNIFTGQDLSTVRQCEFELGSLADQFDRFLRILNTGEFYTDPVRPFDRNVRIGQTHGVDTACDDELCAIHCIAQFLIGQTLRIGCLQNDVYAALDVETALDLRCHWIHFPGQPLDGDDPAENGDDDK